MSLWAWTLEAYSRPGVSQACLRLQDEHGFNTPYLLWAVWAEGANDQSLNEAAGLAKAG
ncbi:MAG: TIGR02444 family protein [Phenylobacterium zucineum]|nr:MAG: TIGR02444 family protein [Phenylobacterium zucineum]